jgi:manganese/zinc/iron transport system ATP- binding protein
MKHALAIEHVSAMYRSTNVLTDINVCIEPGSMVGILGPNGAGKSTLLKAIVGLVKPSKGTITFLGGARTKHMIAYVPQRIEADWDFPVSVRDVVLMGRYGRIGWFARPQQHDIALVEQALETVGLSAYANRHIAELSGGQQQRVFLARALVQQPEIYLLDEPLAGIDMPTEQIIIDVLLRESRAGKTVLAVHHDLHTAPHYFDHLMLINNKLIAYGPSATVNPTSYMQSMYRSTDAACI